MEMGTVVTMAMRTGTHVTETKESGGLGPVGSFDVSGRSNCVC